MFTLPSSLELFQTFVHPFPCPLSQGPEGAWRPRRVHGVRSEQFHEQGNGAQPNDEQEEEKNESLNERDLLRYSFPHLPESLHRLENLPPERSVQSQLRD